MCLRVALPCRQPQATRLASAEQHTSLAETIHGSGGSPAGLKLSRWAWRKAGTPAAGTTVGNGSSIGGGSSSGDLGATQPKLAAPEAAAASARRRPIVPWAKLALLLGLLGGVVAGDLLKMRAACPSLAYWLRATAMLPVTIGALLAVRWGGGRLGRSPRCDAAASAARPRGRALPPHALRPRPPLLVHTPQAVPAAQKRRAAGGGLRAIGGRCCLERAQHAALPAPLQRGRGVCWFVRSRRRRHQGVNVFCVDSVLRLTLSAAWLAPRAHHTFG